MNAEYAKMSEVERQATPAGSALAQSIAETTAKLKEEEALLGDHRRNVGNYEEATVSLRQELKNYVAQLSEMKAAGQDNSKEFQDLVQRAGEVKKAINDTSQEIQFMAKDTKALSSINEGVQTIVAGFGLWQAAAGLTDKENQQLTETIKNMQITMSALQSLQAIQNTLQKESNLMVGISVLQTKAKAAAEALATEGTIAATVAQKALNFVANANPYVLLATALATVAGAFYLFASGANEAKKAQEALNREMDLSNREVDAISYQHKILAEKMRGAGKTQIEIAEKNLEGLRKEAAEKEKINNEVLANQYATDEQRQKAGEEMIKSQQDLHLAEEKLNADKNEKIRNDNKASAEKFSSDSKQAAQQAAADAKERADKQIEAIRQAQDTALALVKEGVEKQREQINLSANREIEDLKNKLATEKNLTGAAREAINQTILNIEEKQRQDLAALDDQAIADRIDKETKRIQLQLDAVRTGTQQEFDLRQQLIEENRQKELQDNMQLAEEKRQDEALINAKYDKQRQDEIDNLNQIILEKKKQSLENEFNESMLLLGNNEIAKSQLQLQYAEQLNQNLLSMDEQTKQKQFKTEEDYNAAIISSRQKVAEETIKINQLQQQQLQNQLSATGQFSSAIGDIMNTLGENNEQYAEFQKLLAIFNIAINTAQAISGAIAAATPGDPYTTAIRIAAAVAAAVAGMAAALTKANSAKQPKAPRFASGGLISGSGSGTSDSIPAKLSAGESVLTAAATSYFAPMLSAFNQIGGGVPISSNTTVINNNSGPELGEEMLARAFEKGYIRGATKFPPVVSVGELTRVQNQIKVMERLSKLQ